MNKFQKHMQLEALNLQKIDREAIRKLGKAFVDALEATYDEYWVQFHKAKAKNPEMEAVKKAVNDLTGFAEEMKKKYGSLF